MARPTKKSEARIDAVIRALKSGSTRMAAAAAAGIAWPTLRLWISEDAELFDQVEQAEGEWEVGMCTVISRAAVGTKDQQGDWRAALELLKRRRRADFGDSLDLRKLTDEDIVRLLALDSGGSGEARPA